MKPLQQGKALYDTNKEVINGALTAMASATGVGTTIEDWIGECSCRLFCSGLG